MTPDHLRVLRGPFLCRDGYRMGATATFLNMSNEKAESLVKFVLLGVGLLNDPVPQ